MSEARRLRDLLAEGDELTVVCHDNPDPDCLASAMALAELADEAGIGERHIVHGGSVSHQQNRAFVNLLDLDLATFDREQVVDRGDGHLLAFVDHAVPGRNNGVPEGTDVDIVVDHHPAEAVAARFVDHRESVGATATILTEYFRDLELAFGTDVATGLLFAIHRETLSFLRGATTAEYEAAAALHDAADGDTLDTLANPSVTGATADAIADAIDNRHVRRSVLVSNVGRTSERDALPQAADYLLRLEGVSTAVVYGVVDDAIQLSARSTDDRRHIGDELAAVFEGVGSAGGHREMAGARIPLGLFADYDADEGLVDVVEDAMTSRLLDGLGVGEPE